MPLKLNVGLNRKVGEPNYGSRGANINVEVEVDGSLLGEPAKLQERIRQLFDLVRDALGEELSGTNGHGPPGNGETPRVPARSTNGHNGAGRARPATPSQVKAIFAIARQQRLELTAFLKERFQLARPEDLTLPEASSVIDELKNPGR